MPYADPGSEAAKACARRAHRKHYHANRQKQIERVTRHNKEHMNRIKQMAVIRRSQKTPIEKVLFNNAKQRARMFGIPFELQPSDIVVPSACPILWIPLVVGTGCAKAGSPSLDRINPDRGYIPGNVQVISHKANTIKSNATLQEIEAVYKHMLKLLLVIFVLFGAANVSAESKPTCVTRGCRNNNVGNVQAPHSGRLEAWPGAVGVDDVGYMRFRRPIDGVRAIVINLRGYHRKHGYDTVLEIICRWTKINDTPERRRAYVRFVAGRLGVRTDERLDMNDPRVLRALTRAIIYYENGQDPYPDRLYDRIFPTTARRPRPPAPAPRPSGRRTAASSRFACGPAAGPRGPATCPS